MALSADLPPGCSEHQQSYEGRDQEGVGFKLQEAAKGHQGPPPALRVKDLESMKRSQTEAYLSFPGQTSCFTHAVSQAWKCLSLPLTAHPLRINSDSTSSRKPSALTVSLLSYHAVSSSVATVL
ncbi:unnamed protein product [Rangifer tarandus platyrhynchus]|uniref:Uncharacterized protein n=2 Tax=Rangifer tarandus platyrhynchus TaxID=3082113 RepID=A0AC59Y2Y6_RANTA|nr:unnamed protein product [Rangifer tarandus platyrhynchus]